MSKSTWKILSKFLEYPWKKFYIRELIKISSISPNTAIRVVRHLEKSKILVSNKLGNIVEYKLNKNEEVVKKLLMLYHEKFLIEIPEKFKFYIKKIRENVDKKNILSLVLFGSVAKNKATDSSDIDIMVIYEKKPSSKVINSVFEKYSKEVQIVYFSRKEFDKKYNYGNELIINILKTGKIIYDRDFYYTYIFNPIPNPSKEYIEDILNDCEKKLYFEWEILKKNHEFLSPSLYTIINKISITLIMLNKHIPDSRKDIEIKLEKIHEKELLKLLRIVKKSWDGEIVKITREELESMLTLLQEKIRECYTKLEEYQ